MPQTGTAQTGRPAAFEDEADSVDQGLPPWQFFLLCGMLSATAVVIVATGQSIANVIILSLTVVAASFVGLGAYRMLVPLVSPAVAQAPTVVGGRTRAALEREKALALRAIKELEFDFAMGKVAQADFDEMSGRLRRRAMRLIQQLDASAGYREQIEREVAALTAAPTTPGEAGLPVVAADPSSMSTAGRPDAAVSGGEVAAQACPGCGTPNDADARFCKQCGTSLASS